MVGVDVGRPPGVDVIPRLQALPPDPASQETHLRSSVAHPQIERRISHHQPVGEETHRRPSPYQQRNLDATGDDRGNRRRRWAPVRLARPPLGRGIQPPHSLRSFPHNRNRKNSGPSDRKLIHSSVGSALGGGPTLE